MSVVRREGWEKSEQHIVSCVVCDDESGLQVDFDIFRSPGRAGAPTQAYYTCKWMVTGLSDLQGFARGVLEEGVVANMQLMQEAGRQSNEVQFRIVYPVRNQDTGEEHLGNFVGVRPDAVGGHLDQAVLGLGKGDGAVVAFDGSFLGLAVTPIDSGNPSIGEAQIAVHSGYNIGETVKRLYEAAATLVGTPFQPNSPVFQDLGPLIQKFPPCPAKKSVEIYNL